MPKQEIGGKHEGPRGWKNSNIGLIFGLRTNYGVIHESRIS